MRTFFLVILMVLYSSSYSQTPDFTHLQGYLFDPSNTGIGDIGIGSWNFWDIPGARGHQDIIVFDIERGWNLYHEDIDDINRVFGDNIFDHHGTAVLVIIAGLDNGKGITGIAPDVSIEVGSWYFEGKAKQDSAIELAREMLSPGDIMVLEMEYVGSQNLRGARYPVEYGDSQYYAIVNAFHDSIIVIESAGNGGVNLNNVPQIMNRPHSRAILVASGQRDAQIPASNTNYGDRIDVNAWGENVVTSGYGHLYGSQTPGNPNDDYTNIFDGTSAATAIVAGVVASIQGIYYTTTGQKMGPRKMRKVLINSAIGDPNSPIGKRPSLPHAVNYMIDNLGLNLPRMVEVRGDQIDENGNSFDSLAHYKLGKFLKNPVPHDYYFAEGSNQTLKSIQEFKPGSTQKYNEWLNFDIINHKTIANVLITQPHMRGQFKAAHNATVRSDLISAGGSQEVNVSFADPWLIDFNDPPYGMRNQGMAAPLKTYPSPLNLTLGSDFKGVFLNQGWPNWNPPYYSVRAQLTDTIPFHGQDITWYFQGWDGTDVQFEHPDQTETAVVFKQADAVAQAQYKGHLVSNSPQATGTNNGRRLVYTFLAYPHITVPFIVYSDRGNVL